MEAEDSGEGEKEAEDSGEGDLRLYSHSPTYKGLLGHQM